jgi:hypothetical protein
LPRHHQRHKCADERIQLAIPRVFAVFGVDERFSNLNRNSLNVDKRINEAIAIAYYLESNDLIKFRDEKIMYPNVMKNI